MVRSRTWPSPGVGNVYSSTRKSDALGSPTGRETRTTRFADCDMVVSFNFWVCRALTLGDGRDHPLGLADHAALAAPALARPVAEVLEAPGWLAALAVLLGG